MNKVIIFAVREFSLLFVFDPSQHFIVNPSYSFVIKAIWKLKPSEQQLGYDGLRYFENDTAE